MALGDESRVKAKSDVVSRILDGEAVVLDLASGTYFGLNDTGSDLWSLIVQGATIAELRARVLELYDVDADTAGRDLTELVDELVKRGLVDLT